MWCYGRSRESQKESKQHQLHRCREDYIRLEYRFWTAGWIHLKESPELENIKVKEIVINLDMTEVWDGALVSDKREKIGVLIIQHRSEENVPVWGNEPQQTQNNNSFRPALLSS